MSLGSAAPWTREGFLFALVWSKDCLGFSSLAREGRKWLAWYGLINGKILWVSPVPRNIQLPVCIFSSPLVPCNVQLTPTPRLLHPCWPSPTPIQSPPRTHSPSFPKRKCCQKHLTALKFKKTNPFRASVLTLSSISSWVYTVWKVLVHPLGSSQFRKGMHLKKQRLPSILAGLGRGESI